MGIKHKNTTSLLLKTNLAARVITKDNMSHNLTSFTCLFSRDVIPVDEMKKQCLKCKHKAQADLNDMVVKAHDLRPTTFVGALAMVK